MASVDTIHEQVIRPMQAMWNPPYQSTDEIRRTRLESLQKNLASYSASELKNAREYLERNHKGTWPQTPDWLDAIAKTRPRPVTSQTEVCVRPWEARKRAAERLFDEVYANGPIGREALDQGWLPDYRAAMVRMIYDAQTEGRECIALVVPVKYIDFWRDKARRFREAAVYRQSPEYRARHERRKPDTSSGSAEAAA